MATKNRDGKPTELQKQKLRDLGFTKRVKTYREAENAIKRLRNASKGRVAEAASEIRDSIGIAPKDVAKATTAKTRSGYIILSAFIPVTLSAKKAK